MDQDDWRLTNQAKYLGGVKLRRSRYRALSETWEHDHCEFCWAKFMEDARTTEVQTEGYCTEDAYHWICFRRFEDFKEQFRWILIAK